MTRLALVFALLAPACVDGAPATVADRCGPPPTAPGYAVAYDGDRATLTRVDMLAIAEYHAAASAWMTCAGEL